jgi:hypothetical protein
MNANYTCPECGIEIVVAYYKGSRGTYFEPPDPGEIDPSECVCGHEIPYDEIVQDIIDRRDAALEDRADARREL